MKSQVQASLGLMAAAVVGIGWVLSGSSMRAAIAVWVIGLLAVGAYAAWSLRRGRHTAWASAQERIQSGRAVVLWKPGCPFCERLLRDLKDDRRITWVNVWRDAAAHDKVCQLNDGNEYVPTVLIGDRVLRNPSTTELVDALA